MNDNLKRLKPGEKVELHPRLFRQVINPFGQLAHSPASPLKRLPRCIGHFWDNVMKRSVTLDLGPVTGFISFAYRAASSAAVDESPQFLSRAEGAAPYEFSDDEHRPERSEDGAQETEKSPGSHVIPGQSLMGEINRC
jgi:hypothetical protein